MKVEIHRAGEDDVRDLAVLRREYGEELIALSGRAASDFPPGSLEAQIRDFLENADYVVLLARSVRGHPLGYVTLFEAQPYADRPEGILEQVYVRPFYRRRRIARRLLARVREVASEMRWRRVLATFPVSFRPEAALLFFESQAFTGPGGRKQWLLV